MLQGGDDRLSVYATHAYADLIVSAFSGEDVAAATRIEALLERLPTNPTVLFTAARAYAVAAEVLAAAPGDGLRKRSRDYVLRAVELLRRSVDQGFHNDSWEIQTHPDLKAIRSTPEFAEFLATLHLERQYAVLCHTNNIEFEYQESHGLEPEPHLPLCRQFAREGFRPESVSVCQPGSQKPLVTASVWHRAVPSWSERSALAERRANAGVALLHLGHGNKSGRR